MHRNVLLFLFAFGYGLTCVAQQYPFVHYTPKDGLVNSRVRKVYQDSKGRIYFCTYSGLSVYDGARFRNYTTRNGLPIDMVNDVIEVGDDSLLIASNINKLTVLVRGQVKELPFTNACPTVNQFLKSADGQIYISADEGLFVLKPKGPEKLYFPMPNEQKQLPFLGDIVEWKDYLIITTNDLKNYAGLFAYNKKSGVLASLIPDKSITQLGKDKKGHIWISTSDGMYNVDTTLLEKGILKLVTPFSPFRQTALFHNSFFDFNEHAAWLLQMGTEITIAGDDGTMRRVEMPGLPQDMIMNSVFIDRENIAWISTGMGVIKITGTDVTIQKPDFLKNVAEVINGTVYCGDTTWYFAKDKLIRETKNGIEKLNTHIGSAVSFIIQTGDKLIAGNSKSIYEAPIPQYGKKDILFEKKYTTADSIYLWPKSLIDPYGNFIISSTTGILVIKDNQLIFNSPVHSSEGIQEMKIGADGELLVIGRHMGLVTFSLHPGDPAHYLQVKHDFRKEMNDMSPRSMVMDKAGNIWVGTRYNGVMHFRYTKNGLQKLQQIQVQDGLIDDFVVALACDSMNNILVGTPSGLDRLTDDGDHYRVENITRGNSIFGYFSNIWVNKQGEAFALMGGNSLLHIDAPSSKIRQYNPQLLIEEIKVNGKLVPDIIDNKRFAYNQRNLSFNIAAPSFLDEKQVQYSYHLSGTGNTGWSEPSPNPNINLLNLPPGEYDLQLKAIFPSTSYAPKEISYHFVIMAPWWQTWWARTGLVVLITLILIAIIRDYYRRKLLRQQTALEKKQAVEKERTRIASDIHDDLGSGLSTIRFLSEKVKRNTFSEITRDDIDKMQVTSNSLMDKMNEIVWAMNEKNDSLEDLLFYTRSYAMEYCEDNRLHCVIQLPEYIPPVIVSGEMRRNIFLTVKESLHNIVKHANASNVEISIETSEGLGIRISDNGKGFKNGSKFSGGNGLLNMRQRMESIGGKLYVKNGDGFTVTLKVPLPVTL